MLRYISAIFFLFCSCTEEVSIEAPSKYADQEQIKEFLNIALAKKNQDPDTSLKLVQECLELSKKQNYQTGIARSHSILSVLFLEQFPNQEKADYHLLKFKEAARKMRDERDLAIFQYNRGYFRYKENAFEEALTHYFEAYDLFMSGDRSDKAGHTLYAISKVFEKTGRYHESMKYAEKVLPGSVPDDFLMVVEHHKGIVNHELEKYDHAAGNFMAAIELAGNEGNDFKKAKYYLDLSRTLARSGKFEEAYASLAEARSIIGQIGNESLKANSYWKEGLLCQAQGKYDLAAQHYSSAMTLYQQAGTVVYHLPLQNDLLYNRIEAGDYDRALVHVHEGERYLADGGQDDKILFLENVTNLYEYRGDMPEHYRYKSMLEQLRREAVQGSHEAAVLKVETDYRSRKAASDLEVTLSHDRKVIEQTRLARYKVAGGILLVACVLVMLLLHLLPMKLYDRKVNDTHGMMLKVMESFDKSMKSFAGIFPSGPKITSSPVHDERNMHRPGSPAKDGNNEE